MNDLIELGLFTKQEKVLVSSRIVAERFNKEHFNVVRDIEKLLNSEPLKIEGLKYFIESSFNHNGNKYKEYLLTRDGFSLLVMGFTGNKALIWKLKYIDAFNSMEAFIREKQSSEWLKTRKNGKLVRRNETDSLDKLLIYAINQGSETYRKTPDLLFTNYSKLANGAVGIKKGQREYATRKVLDTIAFIEDMIIHTVNEEMAQGTEYHDIYAICKQRANQIVQFAYLPKQRLISLIP